ncbi:MAG: ADP-ribosylation/crystallin J1 [Lysobacteraceae bacterium]
MNTFADQIEIDGDCVVLYRPTGPEELALVEAAGFRRWPPRLPEQPIFYPVTNERYAREIAIRWNILDSGVGYVTRFRVPKAVMDQYAVQKVGGAHHTEWWVPAEDLDALNDAIAGTIDVVGEYRRDPDAETPTA